MSKKSTIFPQIGEGFDDVLDTLTKAIPIEVDIPIAKYRGTLPIGGKDLACVVLDDQRRILTASSVFKAFDRPRRGSMTRDPKIETEKGWIQLPAFLGGNNLKPFITKELLGWIQVVKFRDGDSIVDGYQAEILPELCSLYLKVRREGNPTQYQLKMAIQAEILFEAFAKVGIIALIDEATGYQRDRSNNALQNSTRKICR